MGQIKCRTCGEIFKRSIPKERLPIKKTCPICGTENYISERSSGIIEGTDIFGKVIE